jgi:prepilin-type processing-associated H-X9-DG protein
MRFFGWIVVTRGVGVLAILAGSAGLSSCGTYVPAKNLFRANHITTDPGEFGQSYEGRAEANLVGNIKCEVQNGIYRSSLIRHGGKANVSYLGET